MEQAAATACDGIGWAAGALGTGTSRSYSPTSGCRVRDAAGCDAMAMGDAAGCDAMALGDAGRVREETEASV